MQSNGLNSQPAENESMILEEEIDETYEPTKEGTDQCDYNSPDVNFRDS